LLLDHDGREGSRYLRIVGRLPLDAERFSFSPGPPAGCIPVSFSFGGGDLSPTLGLYQLIAFLFHLLFFDLFGFDRSPVGWIEVDVAQGGFTQLDPILGHLYG
jgi:hypothetical protein